MPTICRHLFSWHYQEPSRLAAGPEKKKTCPTNIGQENHSSAVPPKFTLAIAKVPSAHVLTYAIRCNGRPRLPYWLSRSVCPHKSIHRNSLYRTHTIRGSLKSYRPATTLALRFSIWMHCSTEKNVCQAFFSIYFPRDPDLTFRKNRSILYA